jgi:hypothetical protein
MLAQPAPPREHLDLVGDLVYRSAELLDESLWNEWLALCDDSFVYKIVAHSPEIRRDMIWLEHGLQGMLNLVDLLPKHQSDRSRLTRHTSLYRVTTRSVRSPSSGPRSTAARVRCSRSASITTRRASRLEAPSSSAAPCGSRLAI